MPPTSPPSRQANSWFSMRVGLRPVLGVTLWALSIGVSSATGQQIPASGNLVLGGGGTMPDKVYKVFHRLAGKNPRLVVIPTATSRQVNPGEIEKVWRSRGFVDVKVVHTRDPKVADSPQFFEPIQRATAVWLGGGSQKRIADAYLDTGVEKALNGLLKRGGVVGGTSAGAAIQSRVMIASGQKVPKISRGFDFLPRGIVDQHFLKRNRLTRLLAALEQHPTLVGWGIDEGTALVVEKSGWRVVGRSYVIRIRRKKGSVTIDSFGEGEDVTPEFVTRKSSSK